MDAALQRLLETEGGLTPEQVQDCAALAQDSGQGLDRLLVTKGYLTEAAMLKIFGRYLSFAFRHDLRDVDVPRIFVDRVPVHFARSFNLVGVEEVNGTVQVATCAPYELHPIDDLATMLGREVDVVLAPKAEITSLINRAYKTKADVVDQALSDLEDDDNLITLDGTEVEEGENLLDTGSKAPLVKLVNMVLFQALKMRASDVHIQPYEEKLQVRFRIDGILYDMMTPPKKIQEAIISRVKIMGKMDIAERRLPQDGRATVKLGDSEVDIRISSVPTNHGERLVLRLLDKGARLYELEELGLEVEDREIIKKLIDASHGIVLVTGPTGSGKTTSLYAALKRINATEYNIMTIEDPIEYHLPGISQIEVNYKKGLTFATGLRSLVRQDPDIIFVGEIRDEDTAGIAIQASLTGHLVFSTLHTNDAPGALTRLVDMGVKPFLVASSIQAIMAQRLVRILCPKCKAPNPDPDPAMLAALGLKPEDCKGRNLSRAVGCDACNKSGFKGRKGIFELMELNSTIRELVFHKQPTARIQEQARNNGMVTLLEDGVRKIFDGITTLEEVLTLTHREDISY